MQSFSAAAAESFGSDSSGHSGFSCRSPEKSSRQSQSSAASGKDGEDDQEVMSPLKAPDAQKRSPGDQDAVKRSSRTLFQEKNKPDDQVPRKRKAKVGEENSTLPADGTLALVPSGLVKDRVSKMAGVPSEGSKEAAELLKKQCLSHPTQNIARSAAAAPGSPRRAQ